MTAFSGHLTLRRALVRCVGERESDGDATVQCQTTFLPGRKKYATRRRPRSVIGRAKRQNVNVEFVAGRVRRGAPDENERFFFEFIRGKPKWPKCSDFEYGNVTNVTVFVNGPRLTW